MIDFGDTGYIVLHTVEVDAMRTKFAQLFPSDSKTLDNMLAILDEGIIAMNDDSSRNDQGEPWSRGILLKQDKYRDRGIPVPCVALFGGDWK